MSKTPETAWLDVYEIAHPKKRAFLLAYALLGTVTHAARAAGISRRTHYDWIDSADAESEIYKKAMQDAHEQGIDSLEREAVRRAVEGIDKPIIRDGQIVGTVKEYSDTLLIFMLKGAKPNKYRERFDVNTSNLSNDELNARISEYIRKVGIAAFTGGESKTGGDKPSASSESA